jgi:MAF protein
MRLILASQSPRRIALLREYGIDCTAIPADIAEEAAAGERPAETAVRLAREKAAAVRTQVKSHPHYILAADTVVADGMDILGKPVDLSQAREFLVRLRGRTHRVITGLCLFCPGEAEPITGTMETTVRMRDYGPQEIDAYVLSGDALDKAGAYAIQHAAFHPVAAIDGCFANVVGLPVCRVQRMLADSGWIDLPPLPDGCRAQTACGYRNME